MHIPQFGTPTPNASYIPRPAAHAIISDADGRVAVVIHQGKRFLPGGGIDLGEDVLDALHREMREETGWTIRVGREVCRANEYVDVPREGACFNKQGIFFLAEIVAYPPPGTQVEHESEWLTIEEFAKVAAHESHVWACEQAVKDPGFPFSRE